MRFGGYACWAGRSRCSMSVMATVLVFTEETIETATDYLSFERAREYLDRVDDLLITSTEVTATVYGTSPYDVSLTARNRRVSGQCSCPYGQENAFCKHCVAVGLAAVRRAGGELKLVDSGRGTAAVAGALAAGDPLEAWFARASKDEIVEVLREVLDEDPGLRQRLELRAAVLTSDVKAVQAAVWELAGVNGDADYSDARAYAARVEQAAGAIADLADAGPGSARHAADFATEAIDVLLDEYASVPDYSGAVVGAISAMFNAHLQACEIARPDPEGLARYLVSLVLRDESGYEPDLSPYAPLLGHAGRAVLRDCAAELQGKDPGSWRARDLIRLADGR
jgi:hypothetical protein